MKKTFYLFHKKVEGNGHFPPTFLQKRQGENNIINEANANEAHTTGYQTIADTRTNTA